MLKNQEDAHGMAMIDYLENGEGFEIVERDDGYFDISGGPEEYFLEFEEWNHNVKKAMEYVRGRVLDVGCGAGRHSLYLQERGHEVTGIDISPGAVEVSKKRGLKDARCISVDKVTGEMGKFDTVIMMGNNFGLLENLTRGKELLRRFYRITSEDARIIGETRDPYTVDNPDHLEYHERNRKKGRMGGELRIRVIYKKYKTPWFNYLLVSRDEMRDILRDTGWKLTTTFDGKAGVYIALIEKE